jgi:hypothetical protein
MRDRSDARRRVSVAASDRRRWREIEQQRGQEAEPSGDRAARRGDRSRCAGPRLWTIEASVLAALADSDEPAYGAMDGDRPLPDRQSFARGFLEGGGGVCRRGAGEIDDQRDGHHHGDAAHQRARKRCARARLSRGRGGLGSACDGMRIVQDRRVCTGDASVRSGSRRITRLVHHPRDWNRGRAGKQDHEVSTVDVIGANPRPISGAVDGCRAVGGSLLRGVRREVSSELNYLW